MKKLIAGNWKMNGNLSDADTLAKGIAQNLGESTDIASHAEILICPPDIHIHAVQNIAKSANIALGAQNCSYQKNGAHTGDTSVEMLVDMGCSYVILGHSERRTNHNESDEVVKSKAVTAHQAGLTAIICIGETQEQREKGIQNEIVGKQIRDSLPAGATADNTVIAYEPVWAIGTGKTATPEDVENMHLFIREQIKTLMKGGENARILYGGSMKPNNANALLSTPNVDGGLIGGASLKPDDFIAIAKAAVIS